MAAKGWEVAFGAQAALLQTVKRAGFDAFDTGGSTLRDNSVRLPSLRPDIEREYQVVRDGYARRIARLRTPAIIERATSWKPDLLLCDEMDFGCMVAAERISIPHATMLVIASGLLATHDLIVEPLNDLRAEHGLPLRPRTRDAEPLSRAFAVSSKLA